MDIEELIKKHPYWSAYLLGILMIAISTFSIQGFLLITGTGLVVGVCWDRSGNL